jgi:hypothetical protein
MSPAMHGLRVQRTDPSTDPLRQVREARQPLILVGIGAMRADATDELLALADHLDAPLVVAPMAKGTVPEDHERFAGVLDMACNDLLWSLLGESDLIVAAGFDAVEIIKPWTIDTPVLHVDAVPNTDQIYQAEVELVGDIPSVLAWIREETTGGSAWPAGSLASHRTRLEDGYRAGRLEGKINPTDVVDVLRDAMPRDTIVTSDVGSHKLLVGQGWRTYAPRTSLMSNGLSSMGFSIPGAIGAKIANPDRPVLSFVGDGGFAMVPGELQLASSIGLGLTVVVFVDRSLNRIELKQQALGYPSTATTIDASDLVAMSEAMGGEGVRVDTVAELEKAAAEPPPTDRPAADRGPRRPVPVPVTVLNPPAGGRGEGAPMADDHRADVHRRRVDDRRRAGAAGEPLHRRALRGGGDRLHRTGRPGGAVAERPVRDRGPDPSLRALRDPGPGLRAGGRASRRARRQHRLRERVHGLRRGGGGEPGGPDAPPLGGGGQAARRGGGPLRRRSRHHRPVGVHHAGPDRVGVRHHPVQLAAQHRVSQARDRRWLPATRWSSSPPWRPRVRPPCSPSCCWTPGCHPG